MTPIEEALDALTDAMLCEQRLCSKGIAHNHALLRKLKAAVRRLEPLRAEEIRQAVEAFVPTLSDPDPHALCYPTRPCSTGCPGPRR